MSNEKSDKIFGEIRDELDLLITNLKSDIFDKQQNRKDYNTLLNKYNQLQEEISFISSEKQILQKELNKKMHQDKEIINEIKSENENLNQELNKKNIMNKKIYAENNTIYQTLESKSLENKNLNNKIIVRFK